MINGKMRRASRMYLGLTNSRMCCTSAASRGFAVPYPRIV